MRYLADQSAGSRSSRVKAQPFPPDRKANTRTTASAAIEISRSVFPLLGMLFVSAPYRKNRKATANTAMNCHRFSIATV